MRNYEELEGEEAGWRYADVDLKPMMAIVCILIPLLMFAFSFYEIKIQPVAAPKVGFGGSGGQGTQVAAPEENKVPLNLTVLMTPRGFRIKMTTELAGPNADQLIEKKAYPDKEGRMGQPDYDYPALYARLVQIKKEYPHENTINVGADVSCDVPITWHQVVRTIDTARSFLTPFKDREARPMPIAEKFENMEDFSHAVETLDEQGKPIPLFPQVVFVVGE